MKVIRKKDANIFLHSEEIKKHSEFYKFLKIYDVKHYRKKDLEKATEEVREEIFNRGDTILFSCKVEYVSMAEKRNTREDYQCELCDQVNLKSLYLIKNNKTQHEFWVGSECIKEFNINANNEKKAIMQKIFKSNFPDYDELIDEPKYSIIIPNYLYHKFMHLRKILIGTRNSFEKKELNKIDEQNKLKEINQLKKAILIIKTEIDNYVQDKKDVDWVVGKEIIEWYESLNPNAKLRKQQEPVIAKLRKQGIFNLEDISVIKEPQHVNNMQRRFINLVEKSSYTFEIRGKELVAIDKGTKFEYKLDVENLFQDYNEEIYRYQHITLNDQFIKRMTIIKSQSNIKKLLKSSIGSYAIESFILSDNHVFVEKDKDYMYQYNLKSVVKFLLTNNSIILYRQSKRNHKTIKMRIFQDRCKSMPSYMNRTIIEK